MKVKKKPGRQKLGSEIAYISIHFNWLLYYKKKINNISTWIISFTISLFHVLMLFIFSYNILVFGHFIIYIYIYILFLGSL